MPENTCANLDGRVAFAVGTLPRLACVDRAARPEGLQLRVCIPTTLVVSVPLVNAAQTVAAVWLGVRGSTVIRTPASLGAILD